MSNPKTTERHSHSFFTYLISTSVRVLEVSVMGLLFCSNAVPSPYSLASVCMVSGCVLSFSRLFFFSFFERVLQIHCFNC